MENFEEKDEIKCEKCGTLNSTDSEYCSKCGKKLKTTQHSKNKKIVIAIISIILVLGIAGLASFFIFNKNDGHETGTTSSNEYQKFDDIKPTEIKDTKTSPDKYTWYIKDYVGKNCASIGYTSSGGTRVDTYGKSYVKLIFVTADGSFIDYEDDELLRQYVVSAQNIQPKTEMKLTFEKDSKGKEYSNLIDSQTYEEIVLSVRKIEDNSENSITLTEINASPDKYTWYVKDYVGRNLQNCGYTSSGGTRVDTYGKSYVKLVFVADDGSYIDINDSESLKEYVVTNQNVSPNTELNITFEKNSDGEEYSNLIETQNIEEIELNVKKITNKSGDDNANIQDKESENDNKDSDEKANAVQEEKSDNSDTTVKETDLKEDINNTVENTESDSTNVNKEEADPITYNYYTTNDDEVAKKGNSGKYSYVKKNGSYKVYWIIDFDNGYIYDFTEGNGDDSCEKIKIKSGNLNDGLKLSYKNSSNAWVKYIHFKYTNQPHQLVIVDNDYFEYEYSTTSLEDALQLMENKTIYEP